MPKRETHPLGAPCWVELMTADPDRSREFYGELFGWTSEAGGEEYGGYVTFTKDGVPMAGAMKKGADQAGLPDLWSVYLASDDIKETVDKAARAGGQVHVAPMDIPNGVGTMAFVADASGAMVGIWQPGEHKGFGIVGEPGAPAWFELHTRDHAAAVKFYEEAFGWNTLVVGDTDEFRYSTMQDPTTPGEEHALAGVMDASSYLPEGIPSHWTVYFGVDDTDKTLARIVDLGGAIVMPAEDTPYGRLAQAADPTGALFKLVADDTIKTS